MKRFGLPRASTFVFANVVLSLCWTVSSQSQSQSPPPPPVEQPKSPPSLAEAARKAKEKKAGSAPAKVYTEDDVSQLKASGVSVVGEPSAPATPSSASHAGGAPAAPSKSSDTEKGEAYWKQRFDEARTKLSEAERSVEVWQGTVEAQRVQRPLGGSGTSCVTDCNAKYLEAVRILDEKKAEVTKQRKALQDMEEEFRRSGGVSGWIRN